MIKKKKKTNKSISNILSVILTLFVIAIYLIPNFASAVNVVIDTDKSNYLSIETITVDLTVNIDANERIPIKNLILRSNGEKICEFHVNGTKITKCTGITITSPSTFDYNINSLNGTGDGINKYGDIVTNQPTDFSFGYGYGYGMNLGYTGNLIYNVSWDRTAYQTKIGENNLELYVVAENDINKFTYTSSKINFNLNSVVTLATSAFDPESIKGNNPSLTTITNKLNLVKLGLYNTKITWKTSNSTLVNINTGEITRPNSNSKDTEVILTATFSKSGLISASRDIPITILRETESDETAVAEAVNTLNFTIIKLLNSNKENVLTDLNLTKKGILGTSINWLSNNPVVIDNTGSVSRQNTNKTIRLTATISRNLATNSTFFDLIVPGTTNPDEQVVSSAKLALTNSRILNGNSALSNILSNLYLPTKFKTPLVNITWSSSNPSVTSNTGVVTRPITDTEVILTANITSNSKSATKTFLLTVKMKPAPVVADLSGKVDVESEEDEIYIDTSNAAAISSISVPKTVSKDKIITLNLATLKSANNVTLGTNQLNLSRTTTDVKYDVIIPAGTTITGEENWNGLINLPAVKLTSEIPITDITPTTTDYEISSVDVIIEVGATTQLNFTKAVKLILPGKATSKAGYTDVNGDFHIIPACSVTEKNDPDTLPTAGNCYTSEASDLVIWTKHFTKFAAYTETAITTDDDTGDTGAPAGGGGGGGGCFHRWTCEEWSECTEDGTQTRACEYTGSCGTPNTNPNPTEQECEYIAPEEVIEEEITPEEVAPTGVAAITGAVIGTAKELGKTIWSKIIGGIVVLFVVVYLLYIIVFRTGAPLQLVKRDYNWYYNRAALMHRRADEMYRKGKRNKSEKLFKKAQSYREKGEQKQK